MMEILFRTIAIIIEVAILASLIYVMLKGLSLALFDLGVGRNYTKVITMGLVTAGGIVVLFFVFHLTLLYPIV